MKQEGFVSAAILQNVPKSVFTTTYLSGVGITARGLQQCLIGLQGDLVHAYTPPPSSSPPLQAVLATPAAAAAVAEGDTGSCCKRETLDGIEPTTHRTWLGVKLATFGMSAERIAHCEQVLVQNEGFTTQELLKGCAKSSTLTCSYLKSIGITGLGTQQIVFDATFQ